jgi:Ala-tRNA(Pro) deacylase
MKNIYDIFEELDIESKLYEHPPFFTCDESKVWFEKHIEEKAGDSKNLFLRNRKGNQHYLVVIESHKKVDLKELSQDIGESKLSFASKERLKKHLNLTPGSVSVLALIHEGAKDVQVLFDQDLLKHNKLHYHPPGRNDQTLLIGTEDVKKFMEWAPNSVRFIDL